MSSIFFCILGGFKFKFHKNVKKLNFRILGTGWFQNMFHVGQKKIRNDEIWLSKIIRIQNTEFFYVENMPQQVKIKLKRKHKFCRNQRTINPKGLSLWFPNPPTRRLPAHRPGLPPGYVKLQFQVLLCESLARLLFAPGWQAVGQENGPPIQRVLMKSVASWLRESQTNKSRCREAVLLSATSVVSIYGMGSSFIVQPFLWESWSLGGLSLMISSCFFWSCEQSTETCASPALLHQPRQVFTRTWLAKYLVITSASSV